MEELKCDHWSRTNLFTFADNTYIIIPAANASSRQAKLSNINAWAQANNLKTSPAKHTM